MPFNPQGSSNMNNGGYGGYNNPYLNNNQPQKKSNKPLIFMGIAFVVAIVAVVSVMFIGSNSNNKSDVNSDESVYGDYAEVEIFS